MSFFNNDPHNQNNPYGGGYGAGMGGRAIPMQSSVAVDVNPILRWVYAWMTLGMIVTFAAGFVISQVSALRDILIENPSVLIIAAVAQIGLVLVLSLGLRRMAPGLAATLFMVYSATMGITIGLVLLAY